MPAFSRFRLVWLALAGAALFGLLVYRLVDLQIVDHEDLAERARRQQEREFTLAAPRGSLIDRNGVVLARNGDGLSIYAVPAEVTDVPATARRLAHLLDLSARTLRRRLASKRPFVWIDRQREMDLSERLTALDLPGIYGQTESRRYYLRGDAFQSALGLVGVDDVGLEGLEYRYTRELGGEPGRFLRRRDGRKRPIADWVLVPAREGADLILTLDEVLQHTAYTALAHGVQKSGARCGVAVVADPATGEILAMADYGVPAEVKSDTPGRKYRSHAVTWQYEPGSIFKPAVVAVALDRGLAERDTLVFAENGTYQVADRTFHEATGHRFDWLSTAQVLQHSSNIGMAKIGQRVGSKRLYAGLRLFGFGRATGIELPGEVDGLLRPASQWDGYSVTRIPFGQEICVTAMQLIRAFSILANGGRLVRPYMVKAIVDNDGTITELKRPGAPVGYIVRPDVAKWVVGKAMAEVVNEGTGKRAKLEKWQVFGKTGTANIAKSDGRGYSDNDYVASFISGAPADDPAIVVLVSVRKPNKSLGKGYTGGVVASPVAAAIIEKTLNYLGVE